MPHKHFFVCGNIIKAPYQTVEPAVRHRRCHARHRPASSVWRRQRLHGGSAAGGIGALHAAQRGAARGGAAGAADALLRRVRRAQNRHAGLRRVRRGALLRPQVPEGALAHAQGAVQQAKVEVSPFGRQQKGCPDDTARP